MKRAWLANMALLLTLVAFGPVVGQERNQSSASPADRTRSSEPKQPPIRRIESSQQEISRPSEPGQPERARPTEAARAGSRTGIPTASTIDEKPVVTHHKLEVGGKTLEHTVTVAQMPIKDPSGDTEAHICYFAYTLDHVEPASRPLTFAFNGGPGSASIWVHMGAMGPRKRVVRDNGDIPPPPFQLADNPSTWLDQTDL